MKTPLVTDPIIALVGPTGTGKSALDLDWHVRHIGAPGEGTLRDLLDWTAPWLQDPYDRTRPLWQYVAIDKLADGRGALAMKLHHVVTIGPDATAFESLRRPCADGNTRRNGRRRKDSKGEEGQHDTLRADGRA